ncbi:MAG: ATP synthase subunit I [Candidatus Dormibacteraeota bacterium]|uniref:ATP synthase subunit I n=1 Tax=Candidatus Amunia macphersoniae TaxID=3127014 RepID=A0A934NHD4_9BACT|nr:ATP synthase subunit I [Candidatus Dormibacteraeota bacterium]
MAVLDDHRGLAAHTIVVMTVLAAVLSLALLAARRADALPGLLAGTAVGVADVTLLSRSLRRFAAGDGLSARALGAGMLSRFLSIGILLGLVLCIRGLNPLAALVGFLFTPLAIGVSGVRALRRDQKALVDVADARR